MACNTLRPSVRWWRRQAADDPLGVTAGLLIWGLGLWWIVPALSLAAGSIINRIVLVAGIPLPAVRDALVLLGLLGLLALFGCDRRVQFTWAWCELVWWTFIWGLSVLAQPLSTSTGTYGLVVVLAVQHLLSLRKRQRSCRSGVRGGQVRSAPTDL